MSIKLLRFLLPLSIRFIYHLTVSLLAAYIVVLGYHYCWLPPFHCGTVAVELIQQKELKNGHH